MSPQQASILCKLAYGDWPHLEITDDLIASWAVTLGDCDFERAKDELVSLLRTRREWPPKANELRGAMEAKAPIKALPAPELPYGSGLETYYVNGRPYLRASRTSRVLETVLRNRRQHAND